jgi:hypothetical protein
LIRLKARFGAQVFRRGRRSQVMIARTILSPDVLAGVVHAMDHARLLCVYMGVAAAAGLHLALQASSRRPLAAERRP